MQQLMSIDVSLYYQMALSLSFSFDFSCSVILNLVCQSGVATLDNRNEVIHEAYQYYGMLPATVSD